MKCLYTEKMVLDFINNDKQKLAKIAMLEKYKRKLEIKRQQQQQMKYNLK